MVSTLLDNQYVLNFAYSVGGIIATLLTQQILRKRGLFTYSVHHSPVGVSADDAVFGSVRVTWDDNVIANLYFSTVELINNSSRDYEKVEVRAYTSDTDLLTENTEIVGTTRGIGWTHDFSNELFVAPGNKATEAQIDLHSHRRDYFIPTMNRGQVVRFYFLNAAKTEKRPSIWLDVLHPGVKIKFKVRQNQVFGVSQPTAALAGVFLGIGLVSFIIAFVQEVWIAALCSFVYGLVAQLPGAYTVKAWRWARDWFGS